MATTPERIQPNDVLSRHYWSQMCPNFTECATSDAEGKACPTCGTELPGFIAEWVECTACQGRRFYCGPNSESLPGKPDLRCWDCDAPMSY
jgi:DNA-directed RNA polymerase subunit RPC12/RpoP